jgi:lysophospholipase L1-like esterase
MIHIAIMGDSHSLDDRVKTLTETKLLKMRIAANVSIYATYGENATQALTRVDYIAKKHADYYVLQYGTNDAAVHNRTYRSDLEAMIQALGTDKTFVVTPPPVNPQAPLAQDYLAVDDYAKQLEGMAYTIDLHGSISKSIQTYIGRDGIHMTQVGYELYIDLIAEAIAKQETHT